VRIGPFLEHVELIAEPIPAVERRIAAVVVVRQSSREQRRMWSTD
jgi:hypothetical protein